MNTFTILIRGINVGGKNKVSMVELKKCLEELGFSHGLRNEFYLSSCLG